MNYKLFFDNWFSLISLNNDLKDKDFQSVATIQIKRVPDCTFPLSKHEFTKSKRGYFESMVNKENGMVLIWWNDNIPVNLIKKKKISALA